MNPAVRLLLLGGQWTPARLFRSGEQGAWYDPADLSTMSQDSAGTTPAAVGQPVGRILDKSGRGNHATQATAASRPTLRQDASGYYYLEFDGVDDGLATASVDFPATDKMAVFAGVHKASDAARAKVVELGAPSATGSFGLEAPTSAAANYGYNSTGSIAVFANTGNTFASPHSAVLTGVGDIGGDVAMLRVNGVQAVLQSADQGTGTYSNAALNIGRRGGSSLPFNGRLYGLIVRGAATDAALISRAERFVGSRMGIQLP